MIFPKVLRSCFLACLALLPLAVNTSPAWRTEDPEQSLPPVVDPGAVCVQSEGKPAPSDAIVLFSGMDLSGWRSATADVEGYGDSGLPSRTMGRSLEEDRAFFAASLAGGTVLGVMVAAAAESS